MPAFDLMRIHELKRRMVSERNLHSIVDYYIDNLGMDRDFLGLGAPVEPECLPSYIQRGISQFVARVMGPVGCLIELLPVEIPGAQLMHGNLAVNGGHGLFVWATDLDLGIVTFHAETADGNVHCGRVTMTRLEELSPSRVN
ncbi:MAG: hypothetical protein FJW39_15330 [Acidobacteria bacterium]|nr:hypothetical protein [Acidobacteriota bacterium]